MNYSILLSCLIFTATVSAAEDVSSFIQLVDVCVAHTSSIGALEAYYQEGGRCALDAVCRPLESQTLFYTLLLDPSPSATKIIAIAAPYNINPNEGLAVIVDECLAGTLDVRFLRLFYQRLEALGNLTGATGDIDRIQLYPGGVVAGMEASRAQDYYGDDLDNIFSGQKESSIDYQTRARTILEIVQPYRTRKNQAIVLPEQQDDSDSEVAMQPGDEQQIPLINQVIACICSDDWENQRKLERALQQAGHTEHTDTPTNFDTSHLQWGTLENFIEGISPRLFPHKMNVRAHVLFRLLNEEAPVLDLQTDKRQLFNLVRTARSSPELTPLVHYALPRFNEVYPEENLELEDVYTLIDDEDQRGTIEASVDCNHRLTPREQIPQEFIPADLPEVQNLNVHQQIRSLPECSGRAPYIIACISALACYSIYRRMNRLELSKQSKIDLQIGEIA